jgi:F0F1-type ATP synthase alpha subunit
VADVQKFEKDLLKFIETKYASLLAQIAAKKQIEDSVREQLKTALGEFKERFRADAAR